MAASKPPPRSGVPVSRDDQKTSTRNKLIAAAAGLFERYGFPATSVGQIAKAAGVNRATFYLHFESKGHVFGESLHAASATMRIRGCYEALDAALRVGTRAAIVSWLTDQMAQFTYNTAFIRLCSEASTDPDAYKAIAAFQKDILDDAVFGFFEAISDEMERARKRQLLQILLVQLQPICFQLDIETDPAARLRTLESLADIWWCVLLAHHG